MAWRKVWIWERSLKSGTKYVLRWHDKRGKIRSETVGTDKKLAERLRTQKEADLNAGKLNETPEVGFDEFKEREMQAMQGRLAESSLVELERALRLFGDITEVRKLSDITPAMVEQFLSKRLDDVATATANKNLRTLKAALNRAVERGQIRDNPARKVKQVKEPEREIRVLTEGEVGALLEAAPSLRWEAFIALAVTTGMRLGEILYLRWRDVDLQERRVRIVSSDSHVTKSRRNRTVSLPVETRDLIEKLPRRCEFVFSTQDGGRWKNHVHRGFRKIVDRAEIEYCTPHDLRRTFVSHLAMKGASAPVVKELAGHSSIMTTQRYYTKISEKAMRSAQDKLEFGKVISDGGEEGEREADGKMPSEDISDTYQKGDTDEKEKAAKIISLDRYRV